MSASYEQGIILAGDLHARPAGALAVAAGRFAAVIKVTAGDHTADASAAKVADGLRHADQGAGVVVLPDLGSAVLTVKAVLERAWLHNLRDRLSVEVAAHFAAQLPELLRGVFFDGWNPGRVPQKYDRAEYLTRFAREARVHDADVAKAARIVTAVARRGTCRPGWSRKRSGCSPPTCGNCLSRPGPRPLPGLPPPGRPLREGADVNARRQDPGQPWQPCRTAL